MMRKQYTPEQIVKLLREVEAGQAAGRAGRTRWAATTLCWTRRQTAGG